MKFQSFLITTLHPNAIEYNAKFQPTTTTVARIDECSILVLHLKIFIRKQAMHIGYE